MQPNLNQKKNYTSKSSTNMSTETTTLSPTSENSTNTSQKPLPLTRYESQKRRDWTTFLQYLKTHKPPLVLSRCSGAHILEYLRYLDQFGKTKVHVSSCPFYGNTRPPATCPCPLRQAWGSLDALVGRLRAAFEENGGRPEVNPFGARAIRLYLRDVRDTQGKARGVAYDKKKRKKVQKSVEELECYDNDGVDDVVHSSVKKTGGLIIHLPVLN